MTPLVQRSPEEAAAHSAGAASSTGYDAGAGYEPGTQPAMPSFSEAGTHAAPPLPPTTFAEAQFGEAPSAAAAFASTADMPPSSSAFSAPAAFSGSAFAKAPTADPTPAAAEVTEPVGYSEPIPGWSDSPVPAPPGWATAAPQGYEPGAAPAAVSPFAAFEHEGRANEGSLHEGSQHPGAAAPTEAVSPDAPEAVSYPSPPSSYEMPAELGAHQSEQPEPVAEPAKAKVKAAPKAKEPRQPKEPRAPKEPKLKPVGGAKRPLPRWTVPAVAAAVVVGAGVLVLSNSGGSTKQAPIVVHKNKPTTAAAPTPAGGAPAAAVAPAARLASAAPAGFTADAAGTVIPASGLSVADSVHRAAELTAAGVTSATVTNFSGPGGIKVTVLTETAASVAQATALAGHARHLGYTMQASNGTTVFALHTLNKTDPITTALTAWSTALKG